MSSYRLPPPIPWLAIPLLWAVLLSSASMAQDQAEDGFSWLAGDHHIHSRNSVGYDQTKTPPTPSRGGDAIYPIPMNALMAKYHGLSWIVSTDHGGPLHSQVNLQWAYPELVQSRLAVPEVIQFWGMELDTPGADHSSLIIPFSEDEAKQLYQLESTYSKREPWPADISWDAEARMLEALQAMGKLSPPPLLIANHPSRSAIALGIYGLDSPAELRGWHNTAPEIAVGMAGAPGHQAMGLNPDGSPNSARPRGSYRFYPTLGGFDQMTARLGGFWDSMLGEGRNWWITANSDSHVNYVEGGADFWPGEYSKTHVWAQKNHDSIMDGIRNGRIFVSTGDLIDQLFVTVHSGAIAGNIGDSISINPDDRITVTIRFRDPETPNFAGRYPHVERVDLIMGQINGQLGDTSADSNTSTRVIARFDNSHWQTNGEFKQVSFELDKLSQDSYIRVRGTNSGELEPQPDVLGENPWDDLWFYANPIRIRLAE
jgi:hypothetical protein